MKTSERASGRRNGARFAQAIRRARETQCPLAAFNIVDPSSLFAVASAAAAAGRVCVAQVSVRTVRYYGAGLLRAIIDHVNSALGDVCFLHLDHCGDEQVLSDALDGGFDGVMIDASDRGLRENIACVSRWVEVAHPLDVVVEAELGRIRGSEDGSHGGRGEPGPGMRECVRFARETGVDLLGAEIGTAHGLYEEPPAVRWQFLEELVPRLDSGFVVHGGSGLDSEIVKRMALIGVAKINFSTELKLAWTSGIRARLFDRSVPEPLEALQSAQAAVHRMAAAKLAMMGSGQ